MWAFDVKKVVYGVSDSFAKIGASEADNDSSSPPEMFQKLFFLLTSFIDYSIKFI